MGAILSQQRDVEEEYLWSWALTGTNKEYSWDPRVSFHTGTGNIVPRLVTDLTDFLGENKEFSMILGKNWNFKVVFD